MLSQSNPYLSMPMAMFVNMLTATLVTWMKRTIGHIGAPNIQCPYMVLVKLNGMQKHAMNKSATAMFRRNFVKLVFVCFPWERTKRTNTFPKTDSAVVKEYKVISETLDS